MSINLSLVNKPTTQTTQEKNYDIPNFAYPFKEIQNEQKYYELLAKENHGNYLFSKTGFWHGGIHFNDSLTDVKATQGIRAIADGKLVAFRINDTYLQNDDKNAQKKEDKNYYAFIKYIEEIEERYEKNKTQFNLLDLLFTKDG